MDPVQEIIREEKLDRISELLEEMIIDALLSAISKIRDEIGMDSLIEQEMRDQGSAKF